ncbi:hypothetical protein K493DRAFT_406903 [Basidiobolus meristosporus CBS 931.73]|uniref:RRM domain-containing protein n=1 Tax=Basidiobolus meristosporus CBS 931.73 TaxID=1314790 RepID=A0A1Y1YIS1_9FUNG|nr:hypothetical protein K493DRAFT_406903 [Basidiobolus meristosporus CBS 931.73]|eukprot:ORX97524.1 hypothetical protein K493DRAFT_406903 [Basidiobolus meristosporus CBS 931.73]
MSDSNQDNSFSSVPRRGAPIEVPSRYSTPVGSRSTAAKPAATPGTRVLRSRTIAADGKTTETPRESLARSRAPAAPLDAAKDATRSRVSSIGAQGPLRRTSLATRRTAAATATSATGETKTITATTLQPLQRRTSISTRATTTSEIKPLTRTTRASAGSQEPKALLTRTTATTTTLRRTSLLAKRTATGAAPPVSTPQAGARRLSNDIPEIKSAAKPARAPAKETPSQPATRTRLSTLDSGARAKRTPLVTRRSSTDVQPMVTPLAGIRNYEQEENEVLTQADKEEVEVTTTQKTDIEASPDTDFNELPWASKSSPIKAKNMIITEALVNITTPKKGTPRRQPKSTAKKDRRTPFIEGVKNILPKAQAEVQTVDEVMTDVKEMDQPEEISEEKQEITESNVEPPSAAQESLALHAPTANNRKRKAPEELAETFKKISRNTYIANTIFLSDMPMHVPKSEINKLIRELFADFANDISEMKVMSSTLKKSSGVAYLSFKSKEAAIKAKDVEPKGDMKICLMGEPEHMESSLDTSVDPSSKEYARNALIERLLTLYSVVKEQGSVLKSQILEHLPPPAQKYLNEEGKEKHIAGLFKREFGGVCKTLNSEPMNRVFKVVGDEVLTQVDTFEEAKAILLEHKEGPKKPHVVYPNPSGLPRNVYDAQHIRAFATMVFDQLKEGADLNVNTLYEQLGYPKYTNHHGDSDRYKNLIHFWFRSASRFFTMLPMAQIFAVNATTGKITLKLRAPTLVRYKLDGYKVCERDQGPNQLELARQKEREEQEAKQETPYEEGDSMLE